MDQLFWAQTIIAFFVGGIAIASLTFMAEKVSSSVSGILLAMPTNMVVGLFFLALVNSPEAVSSNIEGVPLTLAGAILYAVTYLLVATFVFEGRAFSIKIAASCLLGSLLVWFIFPLWLSFIGTPPLWIGLLVFAAFVCATQWLLLRLVKKNHSTENIKLASWKVIIPRSIMAGSVIVVALILSKIAGPFWGVIVASSFPAAYTSTLIIIHLEKGVSRLLEIMKLIPVGTIGQMFYVLVIAFFYPEYGIWLGTLYAYIITAIFYIIMGFTSKKLFTQHEQHPDR